MDSRDIEKWRVELDSYAHVEDGVEYWLARDLMEPMGYTRWENFAEVVKRAKVSCETNKTPVDSHFRDTTKMELPVSPLARLKTTNLRAMHAI